MRNTLSRRLLIPESVLCSLVVSLTRSLVVSRLTITMCYVRRLVLSWTLNLVRLKVLLMMRRLLLLLMLIILRRLRRVVILVLCMMRMRRDLLILLVCVNLMLVLLRLFSMWGSWLWMFTAGVLISLVLFVIRIILLQVIFMILSILLLMDGHGRNDHTAIMCLAELLWLCPLIR